MKPILLATLAGVCVTACTTNSSGPLTAWGKEGVSMSDYRLDGGQCAVLAATANPDNNGANTAGGINGQNSAGRPNTGGDAAISAGQSAGANTGATPIGGGMYRDTAPPDLVMRAATQQRARDMQIQQARNDALKTCLVERGYTEFSLTSEQRKHLATLKQGSDERREYLYKLGTDPQVLKKAAILKK